MKIVVTHASPDWDAITSVWLIKRFVTGWEDANIAFVPAGTTYRGMEISGRKLTDAIDVIDEDEIIHVDTGLGPLDHHQTSDDNVCGASRSWEFVQLKNSEMGTNASDKTQTKKEAISRIVKVVVDIDHFKEVFWPDATADYHDFSLFGVLEGLKQQKPDQDSYYMDFGMNCLDALLHNFENKIWAEKEIAENGIEFVTRYGKAIGFETINDSVLKIAQKMGYVLVVRRDPRKGYVRIKARPVMANGDQRIEQKSVDLTRGYEKLKSLDPEATWYLHVSKRMLLNGTTKNPKMRPTKLSLKEIIAVLENI